jgi:hypothetical protein
MTTETIEGIRYQSMRADRLLSRLVDSVVRRGNQGEADAPEDEDDDEGLGDPEGLEDDDR